MLATQVFALAMDFRVSVCEKLHAVPFLEHVCTISQLGTIYKTNCFVQTTIWMSQRYGWSDFAKDPILAPIICMHPLILMMACWCQKCQKRVSSAVLQISANVGWTKMKTWLGCDWVVIGSKKIQETKSFGNNGQTKFSPLLSIFFS